MEFLKPVTVTCLLLTVASCASETSQTGQIVGETVQYEIPLADGINDESVAMMTMRDVKTQLYDFMNKSEYGKVQKVHVLVKQPSGKGYVLGFDFNRSQLRKLDFQNDMPYQQLMQLANVDYKMQNGQQIMKAWCAENTKISSICV